jgi:hypothetical protein
MTKKNSKSEIGDIEVVDEIYRVLYTWGGEWKGCAKGHQKETFLTISRERVGRYLYKIAQKGTPF